MSRKRLGEVLIEAGLLTSRQLEQALLEQRRWGGPLGAILVEAKMVEEHLIVRALSQQLRIPIVAMQNRRVPPEALQAVTMQIAREHSLIPFNIDARFLDVAMSDPMNMGIIDELRIRTRLNVRPHIAGRNEISTAIDQNYQGQGEFESIDVDFGQIPRTSQRDSVVHRPGSRDEMSDMRDAEISALQHRLAALEALVTRDEDVLRKLLALLVSKGVASREEILQAIQ